MRGPGNAKSVIAGVNRDTVEGDRDQANGVRGGAQARPIRAQRRLHSLPLGSGARAVQCRLGNGSGTAESTSGR